MALYTNARELQIADLCWGDSFQFTTPWGEILNARLQEEGKYLKFLGDHRGDLDILKKAIGINNENDWYEFAYESFECTCAIPYVQGAWPTFIGITITQIKRFIYDIFEELECRSEEADCGEAYPNEYPIPASQKKENITNNSDNYSPKTKIDGKTIKVQRVTPSIIGGKRITGNRIQGRGSKTATSFGHLSNKTILG